MRDWRLLAWLLLFRFDAGATPESLEQRIREASPQIVTWRRQIHQHPELSNREVQTAALVTQELTRMGLEVKTGVAGTGVVALLRGGKPGPTVALRADMDGLPVQENNSLPYASTATGSLEGKTVPVMHACGHDAHTAILLGTARVLCELKPEVPGTVKFIFQPAEEGPPAGEQGGASQMMAQGVMDNPKVDAIFALHVRAWSRLGVISCGPGTMLASDDQFVITVQGQSAHGSKPWKGVDPIVVGAQIIQAIQAIVSRQEDPASGPVVLTVAKLESGIRYNILPEQLRMEGTLRTFDNKIRQDVIQRLTRTATKVAEASQATATVQVTPRADPLVNDPQLYQALKGSLQQAAGKGNFRRVGRGTGSEDFSFFAAQAPALYFFLGVCPPDQDPARAGGHHTPEFLMDDSRLDVGVRAFCQLVFDYARQGGTESSEPEEPPETAAEAPPQHRPTPARDPETSPTPNAFATGLSAVLILSVALLSRWLKRTS